MTIAIDPDMLPILEAMRAAPPIDYTAMPMGEAREVFHRGMAPWVALTPQNLVIDEIAVPGAMPRVLRLLAHVDTQRSRAEIRHVYLRGAAALRTDLPR